MPIVNKSYKSRHSELDLNGVACLASRQAATRGHIWICWDVNAGTENISRNMEIKPKRVERSFPSRYVAHTFTLTLKKTDCVKRNIIDLTKHAGWEILNTAALDCRSFYCNALDGSSVIQQTSSACKMKKEWKNKEGKVEKIQSCIMSSMRHKQNAGEHWEKIMEWYHGFMHFRSFPFSFHQRTRRALIDDTTHA